MTLRLVIIFILALVLAPLARASDGARLEAEKAIEKLFAQDDEFLALTSSALKIDASLRERDMQNAFFDHISRREDFDLELLLGVMEQNQFSKRDLVKAYLRLAADKDAPLAGNADYAFLQRTAEARPWQSQHFSAILMASVAWAKNDYTGAHIAAQDALEIIPKTQITQDTTDAFFETYSLLVGLYTADRNIEQVAIASGKLADFAAKAGRKTDAAATSFNIVIVFQRAGDFENAFELAKLFRDKTQNRSAYERGLAQLAYGTAANWMQDYETAVAALERARDDLNGRMTRQVYAQLATAYSQTGQVEKARGAIAAYDSAGRAGTAKRTYPVTRAEIETQYIDGNIDAAYQALSRWSHVRERDLLKENFEDKREISRRTYLSDQVSSEKLEALTENLRLEKILSARTRAGLYVVLVLLVLTLILLAKIWRDGRTLKKINAALKIANVQAMAGIEAKRQFIGMMGHELRTPLNGIIGLSDTLAHTSRDPQVAKFAHLILTCGRKLHDTVENVLAVAANRNTAVTRRAVDIDAFIKDVLSPKARQAKDKGLSFTVKKQGAAPATLYFCETRTRRILEAIVDNAVKFTKSGSVSLSMAIENEALVIRVEDTGVGMDEARLNYLFEAFTQADTTLKRDFEGSGLGLFVARTYTEQQGGQLELHSVPAKGTVCRVTLPNVLRPQEPGTLPEDASSKVIPANSSAAPKALAA